MHAVPILLIVNQRNRTICGQNNSPTDIFPLNVMENQEYILKNTLNVIF